MSIYSRYLAFAIFTAALSFSCSSVNPSAAKTPASVDSQNKPLKNYVSLDLAYPYYKMLLDKLELKVKTVHKPLKNRGEAHITLITPPEFKILSTKLSAEKIHQISNDFLSLEPKFQNACIGHFEKANEHVYYVVAESTDLIKLRLQLSEQSGLTKAEFDPELFFPHITLGFTERDIHYEEGAVKNKASCPKQLQSVILER